MVSITRPSSEPRPLPRPAPPTITFPDSTLSYKPIVTKRRGCGINVGTRTSGTERGTQISPRARSPLILDRGAESSARGEDSLFKKWCWEKWTTTCRGIKLEPYLTPLTKINSK